MLFVLGFDFLDQAIREPVTHDETVRAVYSVFFASLTIMLIISTGIIMYSGMYRSGRGHISADDAGAATADFPAQVSARDVVQ